MRWSDTVDLIAETSDTNDMADPVTVESSRTVFANRKSIRQTEFYQAAATGLRPEWMFEVRSMEYGGESKLRHEGRDYSIIRTYSRNGEIMELICSGLVVSNAPPIGG